METEKLYYRDCHLKAFRAQVVSCEKDGETYRVILDRTAFYPEGGGQAWDEGTLNGVKVTYVSEEGDQVVHLCAGPLEPGTQVEGRIDWDRRFDLMQQHSGEHIVSGLIHAKYGWHNVGFHMGSDVITIDFDGEIPAEDLPELEKKANQAIYDNLPLHIWYPSPEELPGVPYRTKRALPWPVRVVEIPGYDMCACCGVHVAATGEIGLIKLLSCIRFRSGVRMEMVCGARALRYLTEIYRQNLEVSHAFSAKLLETGAAARTANETLDGLKAQIGTLRQEIFRGLAEKSRGAGDVLLFGENLDSVQVRQLADLTAEVCGGTAAVFSGNDARGYAYCLVTRSGDLRELGKQMNAALSGRGGGKPVFQQGSVRCSGEKIREFFQNFLEIS